MSAYRFCRTDDIGLLVDALNRCWSPYFPDEPPMTPAAFKRSIRDLQVWCSSCMVAFSGADLIGVLIGAKRPSGTLIHKIAVHPDHRRQGHGRHLLASLGSKLAILGPPRMIAEVPETLDATCGLFSASGYVQEAQLTDYVWQREETDERAGGSGPPPPRSGFGEVSPQRFGAKADGAKPPGLNNAFMIPVTVDDLAANGLLEEADAHPQVCWERSVETLRARKDDIAGLAVASDEQIEAYLLYVKPDENLEIGKFENLEISRALATASALKAPAVAGAMPDFQITRSPNFHILALRSFVEDGGARLTHLLSQLGARGTGTVRFPKVHPAEMSKEDLDTLGFRPAGGHLLYAATARSD
jgi:GNAT superfamily N-acetyltransferase